MGRGAAPGRSGARGVSRTARRVGTVPPDTFLYGCSSSPRVTAHGERNLSLRHTNPRATRLYRAHDPAPRPSSLRRHLRPWQAARAASGNRSTDPIWPELSTYWKKPSDKEGAYPPSARSKSPTDEIVPPLMFTAESDPAFSNRNHPIEKVRPSVPIPSLWTAITNKSRECRDDRPFGGKRQAGHREKYLRETGG